MEHVKVAEVHSSQDQEYGSDLAADELDGLAQARERSLGAQCHGHVSDVDQVKAYDHEMIDRIGNFHVSVKRFDQEDAPVAFEAERHANGYCETERKINAIAS